MTENRQFETCITVEYCNLSLKQGYEIGRQLETFVISEGLGYYYGSSRRESGSRLCFKFFLHVPTSLYPKALSSIFRQLRQTPSMGQGRVVTNHSWLIQKEKNMELYSRVMGLVHVKGSHARFRINQPEMVAITLSTLKEGQCQILEEEERLHASAREKERDKVLVCIR